MPALWPFPYHSTDTKALYMPDQLFTVRAAGGTRFPTTLPFFRFQASSTLRPTLELGGWPFSGEPYARHLLAEGAACHERAL